jgi:predicted Abi (CAAX) family protease
MSSETVARAANNYARYRAAPFNHPEHYPPGKMPDPALYRPLGAWLGRLILPAGSERRSVMGAWFEVQHAPAEQQALIGKQLRLRWEPTPALNAAFWGATRDVMFDADSQKALANGTVLAERVNGWLNVNPLESLAGAHPHDDVTVRLQGRVRLSMHPDDNGPPILFVDRMPAEISGRYYALVTFLGPGEQRDRYRLRHYNRAIGDFSGPEEIVHLPEVIPDGNGTRNSTAAGIEHSPLNADGWYIYGALDAQERFVVQALAPRTMLRLEPQEYCDRTAECMAYLRPKAWRSAAQKGQAGTVLLCGDGITPHTARASWREGDRGLLIHLYGGIGGQNAEPAARTPLYWGHMAFGEATVIREPLADELVFDIVYHQVYAHNSDGLSSGTHHYSRYSGNRQFGWAGTRPIQDLIFKLDCITGVFTIWGREVIVLDGIIDALDVMQARYRIADGRGATRVGAANNCAQDSAQALYIAFRGINKILALRQDIRAEMSDTPEEAARLDQLDKVTNELKHVLLPWGSARADWEYGSANLGASESLLGSLGKAVGSWRTMLPPVAARAIAEIFFKYGASAWALRSYQVGGNDPSIAPFVPNV